MEKKEFAIALIIDDGLRECIDLAFLRLKKIGVNWLSEHTVAPHVTLCSGVVKSTDDLSQAVKKIAASNSAFSVTSQGLGVFITQTPVVHIRWLPSGPLKLLREKCYLDTKDVWEKIDRYSGTAYWEPKTTIAIKDTSNANLSKALISVEDINFTQEVVFKEISLIEVIDNYEFTREAHRFLA